MMNTSTTPETEFVLGLLQRVGNTDEVDPYLREIGEVIRTGTRYSTSSLGIASMLSSDEPSKRPRLTFRER